jgi:hypothetical protein
MEKHTLTGIGMCPECTEQKDKGFVVLIEGDIIGSPDVENVKMDEVSRSGTYAWIRIAIFDEIFNVPVPTKRICYVEKGVLELILPQEVLDDAQPVS